MPHDFQPSRQKTDLAEVVEMLLDKGIVINADIAVSIGDTQLLGVQVRAAIASFETAAKYGLEFPEGTDMQRLAAAVDEPELAEMERPNPAIDPTRGVNVTPNPEDEEEAEGGDGTDADASDDGDESTSLDEDRVTDRLGKRPEPERPTSGGFDLPSDDADEGGDESSAEEGGEDGSEDEAEAAPKTEES
ncbi:gas vesicle protein GvpJ [Halosolutus halophilus]|uniref:gas vesicle protein GvpJ n=1 Tax=Halosolutus halophilus TaxID=1552990 RepID=UPI0022350F8F|nr:gas vesicle protein [Halosolutus halophilus]